MTEEKIEEEKKTEESPSVQKEIDPMEQLSKDLADCKDKYLRTLAEMENMRKRLIKEKQDSLRFSVDSVFAELLIPLDNFENALKIAESGNVSSEVKNWAVGFQMILNQFKDFLSQNGVNEFSSLGKPFDPNKHQAIEIEETEETPEGTILEEFVKGYIREDRTIRPARVKVAKAKKPQEEAKNS